MFKSKSVFLIFIILVSSTNMAAQDLVELFFPNKSTSYMGVTLDNGKTRNGLGVLRLKNNGVYVGYFSHNKFNGKGMQIAPKNKYIENCGEGFIYVGRWLNGGKNGNGRLYNKSGQLIYDGRFESDKPCKLLSSNPDTLRNFSFLEFKNDDESEIYVGEVESNLPNGFGIYYDDECFTIVESKGGNQYGLGLMLIPSVGWSTFKVEDGLYTVLDNSANLSNRQARRKEERRRARQDLLNAFADFANGMAQVASNVQQIQNNGNGGEISTIGSGINSGNTVSTWNSSKTTTGSSEKDTGHNASEVQSKNRDSNTYSSYESQLIKMNTYWESQYNDSQRRSIQQSMKKIRTKWESRGFQMFHSQWEDWDGKKR